MKFIPLPLAGAYRIELSPQHDARGYFARTFCADTFRAQGLVTDFPQHSTSFNLRKGQIRGMHLQADPHAETKLVRCTRGSIFDVLLDMRPDSPTHGQWAGTELTADNQQMLYIPKGVAHGFQTLEDASEVAYLIDTPYAPAAKREYDPHAYDIAWRLPR